MRPLRGATRRHLLSPPRPRRIKATLHGFGPYPAAFAGAQVPPSTLITSDPELEAEPGRSPDPSGLFRSAPTITWKATRSAGSPSKKGAA